ncbi:MAG: APC family permease [Acidobacteria bacterium]|nr:APC family permease [Acidobacteriota bacterium]MCA1627479.1 APC family permease [Acidobacteriota bacterium]
MAEESKSPVSRLRRDLGTLESYAAVIGILIGAGIFQVTSVAWEITGPSVILGYLVLTPAILATAIPYAAYLSTPLGREPGGEYLNISRTLGGFRLAYIGAWLKIISYIGAGAFLANAFAGYVIALSGGRIDRERFQLPVALAALVLFYVIHVIGIRWFGRVQVIMSALKCLALLVLIVPGLFVLRSENYTPFFSNGWSGFGASLLPLFFAYAGFESIAQTAGEVKDSTRRLPSILVRGITITALFYVFTSIVSFGVLPGQRLKATDAPMAEVASLYLPSGAAFFVTIGAIAAIMTALNGTLFVPSRLAIMFVKDRLAPQWLGVVNEKTATPIRGLTLTLLCCVLLLVSGQLSVALNVAVFALVVLYFIHSLVFLFLPRLNPGLANEIQVNLSLRVRQVAAIVSMVSMGVLILIQLRQDAVTLQTSSLGQRISGNSLTSIELLLVWGLVGLGVYQLARTQRRNAVTKVDAHGD